MQHISNFLPIQKNNPISDILVKYTKKYGTCWVKLTGRAEPVQVTFCFDSNEPRFNDTDWNTTEPDCDLDLSEDQSDELNEIMYNLSSNFK